MEIGVSFGKYPKLKVTGIHLDKRELFLRAVKIASEGKLQNIYSCIEASIGRNALLLEGKMSNLQF